MIQIRVSGNQQEVEGFMEELQLFLQQRQQYDLANVRPPRKGNNPKYSHSNGVLAYMAILPGGKEGKKRG